MPSLGYAPKPTPARATCALCLTAAPLRNSHIIPEFFYARVYGSKHRYLVVSTDAKEPQEIEQKGLREPLLCDSCEGRFNKYETYVSSVFYSPNRNVTQLHHGLAAVQKVDYPLFRCFMLSLIWRMGESTLPMFQQVELGPHAEVIRQALLRDDPLAESQCPFFISEIQMNGALREDYMMGPQKHRAEGRSNYRFIISGRLFTMAVSNQPPAELMMPLLLRTSGDLYTLIQDMSQIPFLGTALKSALDAMRQRDANARP